MDPRRFRRAHPRPLIRAVAHVATSFGLTAPPAWNAGFSRHSPPQAGGRKDPSNLNRCTAPPATSSPPPIAPPDSRRPLLVALNRGTLEVGLYAPEGTDPQQPHDQDECYVILEGEGRFTMGDETVPFRPGDFLFVPPASRTGSSTSTSRSRRG